MGKIAQIKGDLDDVEALLEIVTILRDVSTNRFFVFAQQKDDLAKFLEIFLIFFDMVAGINTICPLVRNQNPATDIVLITSESSFMSQMNSRVCNAALVEFQKNPNARIVCVGKRGIDRCKALGMPVEKTFENVEQVGRYETALMIRDYVIDRVMSGITGKVLCIYIWPKSFNVLKPRVVKLLPATELLTDQEEQAEDGQKKEDHPANQVKDVLQESGIDGIMKVLADIWVSSRLFEICSDTKLAEAAAQAQQLESAMEGLGKEKSGLMLGFKKAVRGDLNSAMREVFTSQKVIKSRV